MTTKERFEKLVYDACVIYGNCGTGDTHIYDFLPKAGTLTADEFARLMLKAEKMPRWRYEKQYLENYDWCAARFRKTMKVDRIEVSEIWD
ncbi:hypothetical protein [Erythrobacter crassostreae]|uniref:Uncharacterized protein n=1 Tax=Erythrobacter crassostreae TaxID=2828328 RepID=A0A9X1F192_9SPHN|nr:hypothetical protein [Erythrobacter crassostrea]MBV7258171.1 hypothetical protein [Erythrobacter crassostrea]